MTTPHVAQSPAGRHPIIDGGAMAVGVVITVFVAPTLIWARHAAIMPDPHRHVEILALAAVSLLALVIALIQIFVHISAFGGTMIRGNRDDYPVATGFKGRLARAHANTIENLVPFAAVTLGASAFGISNASTIAAAALFFVARLVHTFTYLAGITVIRSGAFYSGLIATVMIALQLPWLTLFT